MWAEPVLAHPVYSWMRGKIREKRGKEKERFQD
jgi:hypothetical protein